MKVYELMNELANFPSGEEIEVGICITVNELRKGHEVEDGLYSNLLKISDIEEGIIHTEAP